jgi:hypothetical protein
MFAKMIEKAIREKVKNDEWLSEFIKNPKLLNLTFDEAVATMYGEPKRQTLLKFKATCSMKANDELNNRVVFDIGIYDSPNGEHNGDTYVYFDRSYCEFKPN